MSKLKVVPKFFEGSSYFNRLRDYVISTIDIKANSISRNRLVLMLMVAIVLIIMVRIPFLSNVLIDEEGIFGYLVVGNAVIGDDLSNAIILGRINGDDIVSLPEHPIVPYLFMDKVLKPIFHADIEFNNLTFDEKTRAARLPFFVTFCVGMVFVFALVLPIRNPGVLFLSLLSIVYITTTPLLVGGSVQPQVDGAFGFLLCALCAYLLINYRSRYPFGILFLVGVFSSIGKHEWAIAFFMAIIAALTFQYILSRVKSTAAFGINLHSNLVIAVVIILGILVGSVISYVLSPSNYLGGIGVMQRFSENATATISQMFVRNLKWTFPLFILFILSTYLSVVNLKRLVTKKFSVLVIYIWGSGIGLGYLLTPWGGDGFPRYYIPAVLLLLLFLVAMLKEYSVNVRFFVIGLILFFVGIVFNSVTLYSTHLQQVSITSGPGTFLRGKVHVYESSYQDYLGHSQPKPIVIDAAFGYYYREADFLGQALGPVGIDKLLKQYYENRSR